MSDPVLVDTDPGIYDALPHHFLVATGGWDLKAVAGILPLPRAVANARGLAALLGIERDVPVQALSEKSPGPGGRLVHEDFAGHFVARWMRIKFYSREVATWQTLADRLKEGSSPGWPPTSPPEPGS